MIARSSRLIPRRRIRFVTAAFLLGLAGLVSLKLWILTRMVAAYLS
ncbi:MAG TPA: hypothetical protein VNW24_08765 [Stellaceae bacterium]|nr:hypothetical protein [Stellaceae bacterium]